MLYSGRFFPYGRFLPGNIRLDDIANSLTKLCRFNGHCRTFYSVAEHSIHVMEYLIEKYPDNKMLHACGLLHDATETYLGDITKPLKDYLGFSVRKLETRLTRAVARRFSLPLDLLTGPEVHEADLAVFSAEVRELFPRDVVKRWELPPAWENLHRWTWCGRLFTKKRFLDAVNSLGVF